MMWNPLFLSFPSRGVNTLGGKISHCSTFTSYSCCKPWGKQGLEIDATKVKS